MRPSSSACQSNACSACLCARPWGWCNRYSKWRGCLAALDYSTVCRRQKSLDVRVHYHSQAATACACLPTPAASSFLGEGEWKTKQHGAERRRQWRKVHLGIDVENMQIRAFVVTTNEVGDSPIAAELLTLIPSHEPIASFTGDGAYETQDLYETCSTGKQSLSSRHAKGQGCAKGLHSLTAKNCNRNGEYWQYAHFLCKQPAGHTRSCVEYMLHTANTAVYSTFKPILNLTRATKKPPDIIRWLLKSGWWVLRDSNS